MLNPNPLVSIIMPAYNAEKYIALTLDSILTQTFSDFEVIVIDDGSTDNTASILHDYIKKDQRITLISQPNSGKPSVARNLGIKNARGEFITFVDSDDVIYPDRLRIQTDVMRKYDYIQVSFHDYYLIDENGAKEQTTGLEKKEYIQKSMPFYEQVDDGVFLSKDGLYFSASTRVLGVCTQTIMIRKSCLRHISPVFDEEIIIGEDVDLWFRLLDKFSAAFINLPLAGYRKHDSSMTTNNNYQMMKAYILNHETNFHRIKKRYDLKSLKNITHNLSVEYRRLAYHYYLEKDYKSASTNYWISFQYNRKPRHLLSLFKSKIAEIFL